MVLNLKTISKLRAQAENAKAIQQEIHSRVLTTISTALALVAALSWQTAITDTIKTFIPVSGAWEYELMMALAITILVAILWYTINRPPRASPLPSPPPSAPRR